MKTNTFSNLYIDESGRYFIGDPDYRFFILTSIVLTSHEKEMADLLFKKWREKYLVDPDKSVHAADIFENRKQRYKKPEVYMPKNFKKAIEELLDILKHISIEGEIYYVDLIKLREIMGIKPPPVRLSPNATKEQKASYKKLKEEFDEHLKNQISEKDRILPLVLTLNRSFNYFIKKLSINNEKGYINYESQSEADVNVLSIFHKSVKSGYRRGQPVTAYGDNILGIYLHTKASLEGGIEIADFISYIMCQTLRSTYSRKELKDISTDSLKLIRKCREYIRKHFKIKEINVTEDVLI